MIIGTPMKNVNITQSRTHRSAGPRRHRPARRWWAARELDMGWGSSSNRDARFAGIGQRAAVVFETDGDPGARRNFRHAQSIVDDGAAILWTAIGGNLSGPPDRIVGAANRGSRGEYALESIGSPFATEPVIGSVGGNHQAASRVRRPISLARAMSPAARGHPRPIRWLNPGLHCKRIISPA